MVSCVSHVCGGVDVLALVEERVDHRHVALHRRGVNPPGTVLRRHYATICLPFPFDLHFNFEFRLFEN